MLKFHDHWKCAEMWMPKMQLFFLCQSKSYWQLSHSASHSDHKYLCLKLKKKWSYIVNSASEKLTVVGLVNSKSKMWLHNGRLCTSNNPVNLVARSSYYIPSLLMISKIWCCSFCWSAATSKPFYEDWWVTECLIFHFYFFKQSQTQTDTPKLGYY